MQYEFKLIRKIEVTRLQRLQTHILEKLQTGPPTTLCGGEIPTHQTGKKIFGGATMLERDVERQLKKAIEGMGGMCLKFVSPGYAGVPDRLIILPGGKVCFAEVKRPGETERPLQHYVQTRLRHMGCIVYASVDGPEALARVVEDCRRLAHVGL